MAFFLKIQSPESSATGSQKMAAPKCADSTAPDDDGLDRPGLGQVEARCPLLRPLTPAVTRRSDESFFLYRAVALDNADIDRLSTAA
jgi:hypothetical protein